MLPQKGPSVTDDRVLIERDESSGVARLTLNDPSRKNAYDPAMRQRRIASLRVEGGIARDRIVPAERGQMILRADGFFDGFFFDPSAPDPSTN